jgi:HlyD family secretion protein
MQRIFKILVPTAIVLALIVFVLWRWHPWSRSQLSFRTATVKHGDVESIISASGTIEPVEVVDVGAQVAGRISYFGTDIHSNTIDYGSLVAEDAVLAKIDDSVYIADLAVAKAGEMSAAANLEQTKAKFDQAAAEWKRSQELFNSKLLAQVDYDTAKANYEIAQANVSVANAGVVQAQANLDKAQRNLDFCIIKSPVKGVIIDRRVNVGQTVVASLNAPSLFLIARDLTKMQIWVAVNEADVGRIKPGAPVTYTCDAFPGRQFDGTVGKVRPNATMTQNVVMFTVEVNTDNPDKLLLPYLTANVHFVVRKETNALLVPNTALRWSPSSLAQIAPDYRAPSQADPPADNSLKPSKHEKAQKSSSESASVVWVKEGEYVRPVELKTGTSDGSMTAVTADNLPEGAEVVTGETSSTKAAVKSPFVPQIIRR